MKSRASDGKRTRLQHPDFAQRPDKGIIWQDELVIDRCDPTRIPMIKLTDGSLWATIGAGLFPKPARRRGRTPGCLLRDVRDWVRARDSLNPATASPYDEDPAQGDGLVLHQAELPDGDLEPGAHRSRPQTTIRLSPARTRASREHVGPSIGPACPNELSRVVAAPGSLQ